MLRSLVVRDFVIVDTLELDFEAGFTALTGETGAGKSILIDALSLALGARAEGKLVRAGKARAEIVAEFDIAASAAAQTWLRDADLADTDAAVCLLRRTVDAAGRSKSYINGTAVTQSQLRELAELLVDIHGQHEHQSLLRRDAQLALLDDCAGNNALRDETVACFGKWRELSGMRAARESNQAAIAREFEELTWQIGQLSALAFDRAEWERTLADQRRLAHAAELIAAAEAAIEGMAEAEDAILAKLEQYAASLDAAAQTDPALAEPAGLVASAGVELREAAAGLRQYLRKMETDPERLSQLDRRIADVHEMARRFRVDPVRLPEVLQSKRDRLAALGGDQSIEALIEAERQAQESYRNAAERLSRTRRTAAKRFAAEVTEAMQALAMDGGRFAVELVPRESSASGEESCEFQVAAHAGQAMGALARVASGGELSRLSLAVQMMASTRSGAGTLIFDEVDAGIGGRVAEVVGRLLRRLAEQGGGKSGGERGAVQVLAVTHLPQVAARAHRQFKVEKTVRGGATLTSIQPLRPDERVEEVARMLGGLAITPATRQAAQDLLAGNEQTISAR